VVSRDGAKIVKLRLKAQEHVQAAEDRVAMNDRKGALAENQSAVQATLRLRKAEPDNPRHDAVLASLFYNQALLWEENGDGLRGVTAARQSVGLYESLDPTRGGQLLLADVLDVTPPITGGGSPIDAARLFAFLADARSRLACLLGAHASPDRHRDRELKRFDRDPSLTLRHEINVLDQQSYFAYRDLVACSRATEDDKNRILLQNGEALGNYHARFQGE